MSQTHIHSNSGTKQKAGISNIFARLFSDFINPLVIPPFVIFATGSVLSVSPAELGWITTLSLLFFTLIPFGITVYFLQSGRIQSLDVPQRKNRDKLFRYTMASTVIGSLVLAILCSGKHRILVETAVVFLINPAIGYLINKKFKISIHTAALATAGTLLLVLYQQMPGMNLWAGILSLGILLILLPVMFWSRFRLGIHSFAELTGGALAGIIFTLIEIGIMQIIW